MSTNRADLSEAMKDPVCGMAVDPATAKHVHTYSGETYYFCCKQCGEKFKASPDKYLNPGANDPSAGLTMLAMPSPASSVTVSARTKDPICGMDVNPSTARYKSDHAGKAYYFCSAHCLEKFRANPDSYLAPGPIAAPGTPLAQLAGASAKPAPQATAGNYVCPMCPEVRETKAGSCPSCGMALEPEIPAPTARVEYTCPMHPEIVRPGPGSCPICGMALEPRTATAAEEESPELRNMTRRFWGGVALTVPLLVIAMADMLPGMPVQRALPNGWLPWIELFLATPVVLWGGWPFFQRGWASIVNRSTNMFTLVAMGTGVAYGYSLIATIFPSDFSGIVPRDEWHARCVL